MVERPVRRTIGLFLAHERNHLQPVVPLAELASGCRQGGRAEER